MSFIYVQFRWYSKLWNVFCKVLHNYCCYVCVIFICFENTPTLHCLQMAAIFLFCLFRLLMRQSLKLSFSVLQCLMVQQLITLYSFSYYHCSLRKIIIRCYVHSTLLSRHLLKHLKNYKNGLCFQIIHAVWQDENLSSAHHTLFSVNVLLFIKQVLCLINSQNITSVLSQNSQRKRLGLSHIA